MPGSSPRMRGTRLITLMLATTRGIIPAYAGNTFRHSGSCSGSGDHPRVCGEHIENPKITPRLMGSSPRMRGTQERQRPRRERRGIIPAYAGNTRS